jgi:hypothetical protein
MKTYLVLCALLCGLAGTANAQYVARQPLRLAFSGAASWPIDTNTATVTLKATKITYSRPGKSGTIRMRLWASKGPYKYGQPGWTIGEVKLGQLTENQSYSNVSMKSPIMKRPPAGQYYVTLLLLEMGSDGQYHVQHYIPGRKLGTFE